LKRQVEGKVEVEGKANRSLTRRIPRKKLRLRNLFLNLNLNLNLVF